MRPLRRNLWNPVYLASRVYMRADAALRPDRPWLGGAVTRFLDAELPRAGSGWEWGSGRSTPWFARRLNRLVSVEGDLAWHGRVGARLAQLEIRNVELRLLGDPEYVTAIDAEPDGSLDLVLVDGDHRHDCVRHALSKVRPGGLLVVDNTSWADAWGVPAGWPVVHRSANYLSETTCWRRPL